MRNRVDLMGCLVEEKKREIEEKEMTLCFEKTKMSLSKDNI